MYLTEEQALTLGLALYKNKTFIKESIEKLLLFVRSRFEVLVFGVSGVGKTTLGNFIAGDRTVVDLSKNERSVAFEFYDFKEITDHPMQLIVVPGEERYGRENRINLNSFIKKEKPFGLINVVSAGYQFDSSLNYDQVVSPLITLDSHLKRRKKLEIDLLQSLIPALSTANNLAWMITLVTKQDLWWNEREEVKNFYQNEDYSKHIKFLESEISKNFGAANNSFTHEYTSASLIISNILSKDYKAFAKTQSGYDAIIQAAHWKALLDTLEKVMYRLEQKSN